MRGAFFPLRRRSAGPPPLLWPYPYHLFPRIVRPLCRFQRYSCPARPNPARRRHPARASAFPAQPYPCAPPASTAQSYPCLPPVFSCAPPPAFPMRPIPAPARVIRTALSLRAAGFAHPPREGWILAGSQRMPCPPRHPAPARPRSPCGLSLRPPASSAQPYPSVPRVLSAASPCARVRIHCAVLSLPDAGFFLRSAARVPCAA